MEQTSGDDSVAVSVKELNLQDIKTNKTIKVYVKEAFTSKEEFVDDVNNIENETEIIELYQEPDDESNPVNDPEIDSNENGPWGKEETLLLISLYEEHIDDFYKAKKRKDVWKIISEKMAEANFHRNAEKVERKWINLMQTYRKIRDQRGPRKNGRGKANYIYFNRMEDILRHQPMKKLDTRIEVGVRPSAIPVMDFDIDTTENMNDDDVNNDEAKPNVEHGQKKRRKSIELISREYLEIKKRYWKQKEIAKAKRHADRMRLEERRLDLASRKLRILEKYFQNK